MVDSRLIFFFLKHGADIGCTGRISEHRRFQVVSGEVVANGNGEAGTGRGTLGRREQSLTIEALQQKIAAGTETKVSFDALQIGHRSCSRYGMVFVLNGHSYDALDGIELVQIIPDRIPHLQFDRRSRSQVLTTFAKGVLLTPVLWPPLIGWLTRKIWEVRSGK